MSCCEIDEVYETPQSDVEKVIEELSELSTEDRRLVLRSLWGFGFTNRDCSEFVCEPFRYEFNREFADGRVVLPEGVPVADEARY